MTNKDITMKDYSGMDPHNTPFIHMTHEQQTPLQNNPPLIEPSGTQPSKDPASTTEPPSPPPLFFTERLTCVNALTGIENLRTNGKSFHHVSSTHPLLTTTSRTQRNVMLTVLLPNEGAEIASNFGMSIHHHHHTLSLRMIS